MKKTIFALLLVIPLVLVACSNPEPAEATPTGLKEEYKSAIEYYFARTTERGFADYIKAFPTEYINGIQALLEYDDETFKIALDNSTAVIQATHVDKYADAEYHIEYTFTEEKELDDEYERELIKELEEYCYMTPGTIRDIKELVFEVKTYGYYPKLDKKIIEETNGVFVNVLQLESGEWFVSPNEFEF